MSTSRKVTRGEIYYIKSFPTTGSEQRSGRPAVIVSNNENNTFSLTYEVCYLTLKDKPNLPTHVHVDRGPCRGSTILCEQISTISADKLGDYMCRIPDEIEVDLDRAIAVSLGLSSSKPCTDKPSKDHRDDEIIQLKCELQVAYERLQAFDSVRFKADMYEKMYNDLLERLVKKG